MTAITTFAIVDWLSGNIKKINIRTRKLASGHWNLNQCLKTEKENFVQIMKETGGTRKKYSILNGKNYD